MTFVHLKVHSDYSLLESMLPIATIAKMAAAHMVPAIGLVDTDNMFGALEFSEKMAANGIQPIVGSFIQLSFQDGVGRVALLAMSEAGYGNLLRIASAAHLRPAGGQTAVVAWEVAAASCEGLLCLSGGHGGAIDTALLDGKADLARNRLIQLESIFGDRVYVEIQRDGEPGDAIEAELLDLSYDLGLPIVATNEVYYGEPGDHEAHDVLLAIAEGKTVADDDRRRVSGEHWLKPPHMMIELFSDLPEAIANTIEIAQRCAWRPRGRRPLLPHFSEDEDTELRKQAKAGLASRFTQGPLASGFTHQDYWDRIDYECGVISTMGFAGYFLIVADFIQWTKQAGIPVGPGRGSGAGSLVAWALTITDLDPLRFGLLFERFLNPDRVSMPDFDIDFCQERRDEVISYVQQRYGADRVAQIITHGTMQARAALRDVGRALGMHNGHVDRLCKLVPNNPANPVSLEEAIESEPKLKSEAEDDPVVARLYEISMKLEGLHRHASTHAAGMVIGDRPLEGLVPLYRDPKSSLPVTQFNWKMVEAAGLVKFDFLGLKTLTVLQKAVDLIRTTRGFEINLSTLPLDDAVTYELLAEADTVGVFQLESMGMRESLRRLRPDRFEDIIAMVALYRPGPMDNIPTYISRKHGSEPIEYPHELIRPILEETYGVIIYQEQVIQIAQVMGGYSLGQADLLRRAMGKKDKDEMAKQRQRFVGGARANGVDDDLAVHIFDLIDKFAGYGFNKSHAAAYALIGYHTAYLKANYREEFLAASMTLDADDTDRLAAFCRDARRSGIAVLPPDINRAGAEFIPSPDSTSAIVYAISGLKGVGASVAETIAREREAGGPFTSLSNFSGRVDPRAIGGKKVVEALACAGAFDSLSANRAAVHAAAADIMDHSRTEAIDRKRGQADLFAGGDGAREVALPDIQPWPLLERCQREYGAFGHYLSAHPLDEHRPALTKMGTRRRHEIERRLSAGKARARIAAVLISIKEQVSKAGNRFAWLTLSDEHGQFDALIFSDALEEARGLFYAGELLIMDADVSAESSGALYRIRSATRVRART